MTMVVKLSRKMTTKARARIQTKSKQELRQLHDMDAQQESQIV